MTIVGLPAPRSRALVGATFRYGARLDTSCGRAGSAVKLRGPLQHLQIAPGLRQRRVGRIALKQVLQMRRASSGLPPHSAISCAPMR